MEDHRSEGFLEQQVEPLQPSERCPSFLRRYLEFSRFGNLAKQNGDFLGFSDSLPDSFAIMWA
jgi:hypothetical protein